MKDIGLGIIDQYTVTIVIIVLALAQMFGYMIPMDTSNGVQIFFSLVIFTGYLYLTRTIFRLPVAIPLTFAVIENNFPALKDIKSLPLDSFQDLLQLIKLLLFVFLTLPFMFLMILAQFGEPRFSEVYLSSQLDYIRKNNILNNFLSILDRMSVVFITLVAVIPILYPLIQMIGIIGLLFMVVLYVLKGNLTALIPDELKTKASLKGGNTQQKEISEPMVDLKPQKEKTLLSKGDQSTECTICGKFYFETIHNIDGNLPKICSLECGRQWYATIDKDLSLGTGKERELISQLRNSDFSNPSELVKVVNELKNLPGQKAIWALLTIIREDNGRHWSNSYYAYAEGRYYHLVENISDALREINDKGGISILKALNLVILDNSKYVVQISIELIEQLFIPEEILVSRIKLLLSHEEENVRLCTIRILGKLGELNFLFEHCWKGTDLESGNFLGVLKEKGQTAIPIIQRFRQHPTTGIREYAINILRDMGIDAQEPATVPYYDDCPQCREKIRINLPVDYQVELVFIISLFEKVFNESKPDLRIECPSCHAKIGIKLDNRIHKQLQAIEKGLPQQGNDNGINSDSGLYGG